MLVTLWWRVGFNMLIYLAGLQGISPELYEAGRLDGANGWQQFRHLTVPLVGPSSFFLLIINVIYSFQVFDIVFVLTGGGPQNATSVLVTYAYDTGFVTRDQGYARGDRHGPARAHAWSSPRSSGGPAARRDEVG